MNHVEIVFFQVGMNYAWNVRGHDGKVLKEGMSFRFADATEDALVAFQSVTSRCPVDDSSRRNCDCASGTCRLAGPRVSPFTLREYAESLRLLQLTYQLLCEVPWNSQQRDALTTEINTFLSRSFT